MVGCLNEKHLKILRMQVLDLISCQLMMMIKRYNFFVIEDEFDNSRESVK